MFASDLDRPGCADHLRPGRLDSRLFRTVCSLHDLLTSSGRMPQPGGWSWSSARHFFSEATCIASGHHPNLSPVSATARHIRLPTFAGPGQRSGIPEQMRRLRVEKPCNIAATREIWSEVEIAAAGMVPVCHAGLHGQLRASYSGGGWQSSATPKHVTAGTARFRAASYQRAGQSPFQQPAWK